MGGAMGNQDEDLIDIENGNSLRDRFPGYYRPNEDERTAAYRRGLVSLDANALLDLYRFSPKSRDEFFDVLERFKKRLFVTHQAALEFQRNRLGVVDERIQAQVKESEELNKLFSGVTDHIRAFSNRYQIGEVERDQLIALAESPLPELVKSIHKVTMYDLTREDVRNSTDSVLRRLDDLLDNRIGEAPTPEDRKRLIAEAKARKEARIPPGYKDADKADPDREAGDYLVWRQLITEAAKHDRPVLLISNENKEDWVRKGKSNETLGPRPELVLEMKTEASSGLNTLTVPGLLKEAHKYLGASVSDSTIREAESFLPEISVSIHFTGRTKKQYDGLSDVEKRRLDAALDDVRFALLRGTSPRDMVYLRGLSSENDTHLLLWSDIGRAVLRIRSMQVSSEGSFLMLVEVTNINYKKLSEGHNVAEDGVAADMSYDDGDDLTD